MTAFVVKDTHSNKIALEYISKRITTLKIRTTSGQARGSSKGYALIGVYMSSSNNRDKEYELDLGILDMTYKRLAREGFKPIILGDLNGDSSRLKYANDRLLANWLNRHKYAEISRLYVQSVPNTFLNSRGSYSWIDHIIINDKTTWKEIKQINICTTTEEKNAMKNKDWKEKIKSNWDYERNTGDHRPVVMQIDMKIEKEHWDKLNSKCKNQKRLNWHDYKHKKYMRTI